MKNPFGFDSNKMTSKPSPGKATLPAMDLSDTPVEPFLIDTIKDHERLRSPILSLPAGLDSKWFERWISVSNRSLRLFHNKWSSSVTQLTGFRWPESRPDVDCLFEMLPEASKYPFFLRLFVSELQVITGKDSQYRKLLAEYRGALQKANLRTRRVSPEEDGGREQLAQLAAAGQWEIVSAVVLLDWASLPAPDKVPAMAEVATHYPALADYIRTIMACDFKEFDRILQAAKTASQAVPLSVENPQENETSNVDSGPVKYAATDKPGAEETQPTDVLSREAANDLGDSMIDDHDPLRRASQAWVADLAEIIRTSESAIAAPPRLSVASELARLIAHVHGHAAGYEAALAKGVNTNELVGRMGAILDFVRAMFVHMELDSNSTDERIARGAELISRAPNTAAIVAIEAIDAGIAKAEAAQKDARAAMDDDDRAKLLPRKERTAVAAEIIHRAESAANLALDEIIAAAAALTDAIPVASPHVLETPQNDPLDVPATDRQGVGFSTIVEPYRPTASPASRIDPQEDVASEALSDFAGNDQVLAIPAIAPVQAPIVVHDEVDPLLVDAVGTADTLFEHQEFGLAYHFVRACERVLGEGSGVPYGADELRLIALGARMAGHPRHEPEGFRASLNACATGHDFSEDAGARQEARRIAVTAAVIPTALFNVVDSSAAFAVIDRIRPTGSCSGFFQLYETLEENRRLGFPLTVASVRAASAANADLSYVDERKRAVIEQIRALQSATFRFVLGQKVKHALLSPQGPVGVLNSALSGSSGANAAAKFAGLYRSREDIIATLIKSANEVGNGQVIDGAARERLVALVSDISALSLEYAEAARQVEDLRSAGGKMALIRRLIDNFIKGIEHFRNETSAPTGDSLLDAANTYARQVLGQIEKTLKGRAVAEFDRKEASLALHVPLLWLPGMTWSNAWTPSPNDASRLMRAIADVPLPRIVGDPAEALETAIDKRCKEDAFVPAKILLSFAKRFGWGDSRVEDIRARIETAESTRKGQLKAKHEQVSSLVEKVRRMALGSLKGSSELEERLRNVPLDEEPIVVAAEFMPEEIEGTRVSDVNAAFHRLDDLEREARKLLDEAKREFVKNIDDLIQGNKIDEAARDNLRRLLDTDDLATLSDWISVFSADDERRPVLGGNIVNPALDRFLKICESTKGVDLVALQHSVAAGKDDGPFQFSLIEEERREEIGSAIRAWLDFKRNLRGNAGLTHLGPKLVSLLSQIAFEAQLVDLNKERTDQKRSVFVVDAKMRLPLDASSLMLPDFGSSTNGGWRVAAAPNTVSNVEILNLAEGAEPRGAMVLVFGHLSLERRCQIKLECLKRKRKVVVIDEMLLLAALSSPERRPLMLFEIAQAFTTATPYQDYGRSAQVPPEMFKGRAKESASIVNPFGSYIVYGGRRLGKTALLRHISRNAPEHALFAYLDLVDSPSDLLWERGSEVLLDVFSGKQAATADEFEAGVKAYLAGDDRRRILLMLDEADNFVRDQASEGIRHHHVLRLLTLMADTHHRFKFVLSGLHNVSRTTRSENSPLAQISNDSVRIGPLVYGDAGDAEELIRVPLAALGYEFARREDVWRILSFANYYPILIQVFCQGLLTNVEEQQRRTQRELRLITTQMVDTAMKSPSIKAALYGSFEKTIRHIEQRYELLTYIVAERALIDAVEGADGDGMTASEVSERAGRYWPEAFPTGSDPSEIEYLLDEMEGFGILRWMPSGRWALRSRVLLDLMVEDEEDLLGRIYSFKGKPLEAPFDPKNSRTKITGTGKAEVEGKVSPLTDGQEAEIMSPVREHGRANVLFGAPISNVEHVRFALERSRTARGKGSPDVKVEIRGWNRSDLMQEIRKGKHGNGTKVLVVTHLTNWTPEWVVDAARHPNVAKGLVRPLFIGNANHALSWAKAYPLGSKPPSRVNVEILRPWARSYLATRLDGLNALKTATVDKILKTTGGWNEPCQTIFAHAMTGAQLEKAISEAASALEKAGVTSLFGTAPELVPAYRTMATYCEDGTPADEIADLIADASCSSVAIPFGAFAGILTLSANPLNAGSKLVSMNPLARTMFGTAGDK
ncbi:AAA family ATPase [Mesorhizobium caraganae]|uniref:AAA family ATPase n=1 Tax=Mesorhizobium caraganae TaxID=483206 RepID=UPI003ED0C59D